MAVVGVLALVIMAIHANGGLAGNHVVPKSTSAPAYKVQFQKKAQAAVKANEDVTPAPSNPVAVPSACPTTPTIAPGVLSRVGPYPGSDLQTMDSAAFGGVFGVYSYGLWAGALTQSPSQGIIMVALSPTDPCKQPTGGQVKIYNTPTQEGAVTITGVSGENVTFRVASGGSGSFNFVTGAFG
ncbi:MAG: hypothetical protein M0027_13975 [Candidatus Dormibacteraeota bacterium]|nr:hypothetical protein [Candidatus Dormibacteraeota bacterium]